MNYQQFPNVVIPFNLEKSGGTSKSPIPIDEDEVWAKAPQKTNNIEIGTGEVDFTLEVKSDGPAVIFLPDDEDLNPVEPPG